MKDKSNPWNWEIGDTFYLKLEGLEDEEFNNRYLIFVKIDNYEYRVHGLPIFYVKITKDDTLPKTKEEIDDLEFIQTSFVLWEERFKPLRKEEIKKLGEITFYPDDLGLLSVYRVAIWITQKRSVPEGFHYLGNHNIQKPEKEYIPFTGRLITISNQELMIQFVKFYKNYNLKQSGIYIPEVAYQRRKEREEIDREMEKYLKNFREQEAKKTQEKDTLTYVGEDEEMKKILRKGPKTYIELSDADRQFIQSYRKQTYPKLGKELKLKAKFDTVNNLCEEVLEGKKILSQGLTALTEKQKRTISNCLNGREDEDARDLVIYYLMIEAVYLVMTKYYTKEGYRKVL